MSSEEQHRREGESPEDAPSPPDEVVYEPLEVGEDPGSVPEGVLDREAAEEVVPETAPEEEAEIARRAAFLALTGELEAALLERDEYLDNARRMKAELENSRRRQERERARMVELASERLVKELLPVLDNLERALEVEGEIRDGVRATRDQLISVLAREGLAPVPSDGQSFDPMVHEAVMGQPSDEHEEDTVIQTLERGYILNGKPIRPAKVIVAKQV